jgi:hypothetical protein
MVLRATATTLLTVVPSQLSPPLQLLQLSNKTNGAGVTSAKTFSSLALVEANVLLEVLMTAKTATTTLCLILELQATRLRTTGVGVINATFSAMVA